MIAGYVNPKDFGAVGDGVTDDSDAFERAMNSFSSYLPRGSQLDGTLYIPPGTYYLAKDWFISRGIRLTGAAGYGDYTSILKFAPYKGIILCREDSGPQQGTAFGAIIENLRIIGGHKTAEPLCHWNHPTWEANKNFDVGDKIVQKGPRSLNDDSNQFQSVIRYYECVKGGTTGPVEPIWETLQGPNYGIADAPGSSEWKPNTRYAWGSVVWVPGRYDIFLQPDGSIQYNPQIRSSASMPSSFSTVQPGETVVDDGPDGPINWVAYDARNYFRGDSGEAGLNPDEPIWIARKNNGVRILVRCKIQNCTIEDFLNAGIDASCSYACVPASNANGCMVEDVNIVRCGGGIVHQFDDSSACVIKGLDIRGSLDIATPYGKDVSKEFGIYDGSFLGNTYIGCQIAEVGGPHTMQICGTAPSVYVGQYTEGNCGPGVFLGGISTVIGGNLKPFRSDSKLYGILSVDDWRNVSSKLNHKFGQNTEMNASLLDESYGAFSFGSNDFSGKMGWIYNHVSSPGTWTWMGEANPTKPIMRVNTIRSENKTPHLLSIPRGYFLGESSDKEMLITTGGSALYDYNIRGGKRIVGDRDLDRTNAKANSFLETIVIQDGYRGDAYWQPNTEVATYARAKVFISNDQCIERNGFVYRVVSSGKTGTTEPHWPTIPTQYEGIQIWNGPYSQYPGYQANYKIGDYVRPTIPNGKAYICSDAPQQYGGYSEGQIGITEPNWPTTIGASVSDGELTWTCIGDDTNSYVKDGTSEWVCIGKLPVYGKSNFVHNEGTIILPWTSGTATGYIDLGLLEDNNINVYKVNVRARNVLNATTASAYFQLNATYLKNGSTVTALEAPSVVLKKSTTGNAASWTAVLLLDTTTNHMRVKVTTNNTANTEFKAIREMF